MPREGKADSANVDSKDKSDPTLEQTRWLLQRLLALLSAMAAAGNSDKAATFRAELHVCSSALIDPILGDSLDAVARKCLALCQDFFENSDSYRINYEAEYGDIIDVMRAALQTLAGEADLDGTVINSTARFREMVAIEDPYQLKQQIIAEVQMLERAIQQQQNNREQTMRALTERVLSLEQKLQRTRERLSQTVAESSIDPLTRVPNRRHFDSTMAAWMAPQSKVHPFAVAIFDVDDFKSINDAYGHQLGDRVLRSIATSIRLVTRDEDILARYGGEEFVLLLRNITVEKALDRCSGVLKSVSAQQFEFSESRRMLKIKSTVSCGLTGFVNGDSAYDLLHRADRALYHAKRKGKNRIEVLERKPETSEPEEPGQPE